MILSKISLELILYNSQLALTGVSPRYKFDQEKNRSSDELEGYRYDVTDLTSLKAFTVFVPQTKPIVSNEDVLRSNEAGERIFVEFTNAVVTPYVTKNNSLGESVKAEAVRLVKDD